MPLGRWSVRARLSLGLLALFWAAMVLAMFSYAGGSWLYPRAPSHDFFANFWCDLLREPAHNGLPNARSVQLAQVGFGAIALSQAFFWLEAARLLSPLGARFLRVAGVTSALATAVVALIPSDRFPALHAPAVLTAGGLGFVCGCVVSGWALRHHREMPGFALSALVLILAAAINLVLYVKVVYFIPGETIVLPAAQKVASLALVVWMVAGLGAAQAPDRADI
ncbi:MAG TPA: hypothetical protein VJN18_01370 [Polyangiaceae bacterium]|nr:hypothetical protein [Polyangiaceae bacterium]